MCRSFLPILFQAVSSRPPFYRACGEPARPTTECLSAHHRCTTFQDRDCLIDDTFDHLTRSRDVTHEIDTLSRPDHALAEVGSCAGQITGLDLLLLPLQRLLLSVP